MQAPSLFRALGPRYLALWASQSVSQLGTAIAVFSIPQLISHIQAARGDGSTLDFSITYAIETAPAFLIGMFGGVLLDRWPLRPVMVATNLLRACAFFYLAATLGEFGVGTVFAMAFIIGSMSTLFDGALYSMIPQLVRKDRLPDANSMASVSIQVTDAVGPFFAGILAAVFAGPGVGLFLTGMLFVVGAVTMHWVGPVAHHRDPLDERKPFMTEAANGVRYLWSVDRLRVSTIAAAVANFVMGFIEGTYRPLFEIVLGAPSEFSIGVLLGAMGVGGVLGAVIAPAITRRFGLGRTMVLGLLVMGGGLLLVMFTTYGLITIALQVGWAIGISVVNVPLATIRQHYSSESMLGRVITASRAISWATLPIGALLGGWLGNTAATYPWVARSFPLLLVGTAFWLMTTVVWSDTLGPGFPSPPDETLAPE